MGKGYTKKCPNCGFEFHLSNGVGFMFPKAYEETVRKAKEGKLGKEMQTFFAEHENGALNVDMKDYFQ